MRIAALVLVIVITAGACASSGTAATDQAVTGATTTRRENVISTAEIRESRATTVRELISHTRPSWPRQAIVFLDNDADPTGTALNRSPSTIKEVRFLSKSEAQMKWSTSRVNDQVIQIVTR
jgi:hypothetical protein